LNVASKRFGHCSILAASVRDYAEQTARQAERALAPLHKILMSLLLALIMAKKRRFAVHAAPGQSSFRTVTCFAFPARTGKLPIAVMEYNPAILILPARCSTSSVGVATILTL
jgi:hypothetical protein